MVACAIQRAVCVLMALVAMSVAQARGSDYMDREYVRRFTPSDRIKEKREAPTKDWVYLFNYTPHYFLLRGDSPTTAINMSSQLNHKFGLGIQKVFSPVMDLSLYYHFDALNFDTHHGNVTVSNDHEYLNDFSLLLRYYWYSFEFEFAVISKERIMYEHIGPNYYDIETDRNVDFMLGGNYLLSHNRYFVTLGGNLGYYIAGKENFEANGPGGIIESFMEIGYKAIPFEQVYYKYGLKLAYRYEFSNIDSAFRRYEDLGVTAFYQHSF